MPLPAHTYFTVLSLPPRFRLDLGELEARYREESRLWHPDRHGMAPAAERARVLQRATDLNEAYRVLRSEQKRAEYLLKLRGVDLLAESGSGRTPPAPGFLMMVLELREELQEARAARDHARVAALAADVRGRVGRDREAVAALFADLEAREAASVVEDEARGAAVKDTLGALTQALIRLRYYERFLEEIAAYEEARELEESA